MLAQVAAVVHVHVVAAAVPAQSAEVRELLEIDRHRGDGSWFDPGGLPHRVALETLRGQQRHRADRQLQRELAGGVKDVRVQGAGRDPVEGVSRRVRLAIGRAQLDSGLRQLAGVGFPDPDAERAGRSAVHPPADLDRPILAANRLQQPQF